MSGLSGLALLTASLAVAQSSISGPSLGIFYDPAAQTLRPIWGVPGAATAGAPIDLGFTLAAATISPAQDYLLGVLSDGSVDLITLTATGPSTQALPAAMGSPDKMVLSPTGASAVLFFGGAATAQIFTGLPNGPQLTGQIDLSVLPNAPDALAISDDGSLVLAGVRENADGDPPQGEVFVLGSATASRSIATVAHASALAFVAQSHDALYSDDLANTVALMQDAGGSANVSWNFTGPPISAPDSVYASPDGKYFFAGSSTNGMVAILDSSGSNPAVVACACAPSELRPLTATSIYQLTEPSGGLLWILDNEATNPRALFVPIPSPSAGAGSSSSTDDRGGRP